MARNASDQRRCVADPARKRVEPMTGHADSVRDGAPVSAKDSTHDKNIIDFYSRVYVLIPSGKEAKKWTAAT